MKYHLQNLFLPFLIAIFFIISFSASGQYMDELKNIKDPLAQVEFVLSLPDNTIKDTIQLEKSLQPILELAEKENKVGLQWAYYIKMADGYSIAYDQTNPVSDQYYEWADQLLQRHPDTELEMVGHIRRGHYHFVYRKAIEAFPFFLRANDLKSETVDEKIPLLVKHYQFIAGFFNHIGDQETAVAYLKEAVPFSQGATRERIDLINSIAIYLSQDSTNQESFDYLHQAMEEAHAAKDSVWIGIISGNMADYLWEQGKENEAIDLTKKNIALSMRYDELLDAMRSNLVLASWYSQRKEWNLAKQHVKAGEQLMQDKPYFLRYKMEAEKLMSDISEGLSQPQEQLQHLLRYVDLRDSLEKRADVKKMQDILWKNEIEKYNLSLASAEDKRKKIKQTYQFIGTLLVLTFVILVLLINRSKAKIKIHNTVLEKEQLALSYKKQLLAQEVSILKNSLDEFTETIKQNDTTIHQLRLEIGKQSGSNPVEVAEKLNEMLQSHILTDERWLRFKHVFDVVYPGYLMQMKEKYHKITENDLRIIALMKLDLSNSSMSELLCISVEGVKKAKQRLKKKMEEPEYNS